MTKPALFPTGFDAGRHRLLDRLVCIGLMSPMAGTLDVAEQERVVYRESFLGKGWLLA